jgi:hypothetical protein
MPQSRLALINAVAAFMAISNLLQLSCNARPGFHISPFTSVPNPVTPTQLQAIVPHYLYADIIPIRGHYSVPYHS